MTTAFMVPVGAAARAHLAPRLVDVRPAADGDTLYKDTLGRLPSGEEAFFYSSRQRPRREERREAEEAFVAAWMVVEAERQIVAGVADRGDLQSGGLDDRGRADLASRLLREAGAPAARWAGVAVRIECGRQMRQLRQQAALRAITSLIRIAGPTRPHEDRYHIYAEPQFARWWGRLELRTDGGWSVTWTLVGRYDHRTRAECRISGRVGTQVLRGGDGVGERDSLRATAREVAEGCWNIYRGER